MTSTELNAMEHYIDGVEERLEGIKCSAEYTIYLVEKFKSDIEHIKAMMKKYGADEAEDKL